MQSRYVDSPRFVLLFTPLRSPLSVSLFSRGHGGGGWRKLSPRFHPNVTDLTSREDAARFPRIIILLSYNSFNSRESKTRGSNVGAPSHSQRLSGERLRYVLNERRRDATRRRPWERVEIGTFCRRDSTMTLRDRNSRETSRAARSFHFSNFIVLSTRYRRTDQMQMVASSLSFHARDE